MRFSKIIVISVVAYLAVLFTLSFAMYYITGAAPPQELLALISGVFGGELLLTCIAKSIADKTEKSDEDKEKGR